ncbi:helix-turn-helix domain-containing protein [Streptomyces sp. NPDC047072]|uniref:helix-turn-helix domain-containing protein n=1 Tax=Streptomyces sp. NPDC047072 TaxID=3154809 RepID=UPI0033F1BC20
MTSQATPPSTPDPSTPFGALLRSLRRAARLTLEELAAASGVSVRALGDMERGRSRGPQRRTVDALAAALALDDDLRERLQRLADAGRDRGGPPAPPYLLRTVPDFTGREQELADLDALAAGSRTRAAVLFGPGGQGKTTLAAEAARRLAGRHFPDGCVSVQLHGMSDSPLPAAEALVLLLTALGLPPDRIPVDPVAREAVYRNLLGSRRVLVVLDDAADEAQTRPLLPDAEGGFVLVTSRRPLAGLEGVRRIRLGGLSGGESAALLERILGAPRTEGQSEAITRLTELCGHLPLALRIVGNRLSSRPTWTPARLVAQLADEGRRLSGLVAGDLAVRSALALSYRQLTDSRRLLLRRLALLPGHDTGPDLAAVLIDEPMRELIEDSLDLLVDRGLLEETAQGRYALHDLVRLFAREQLHGEEEDPAGVRLRMADWLLRSASAAGRWFEAPGAPEPWPGAPTPFTPTSAEEAEEWLTVERAHWAGALPILFAAGRYPEILHTARTLYWFSDRWDAWPEWRTLFTYGVRSAAALGDRTAEAQQLNCLAWAHSVGAGQYAEAVEHARRALELATEVGDVGQQGWAWAYITGATLSLRRPAEAAEAAAHAVRLFEATGDAAGKAVSQRVLGSALRESGRPEEALALHESLLDPGTRGAGTRAPDAGAPEPDAGTRAPDAQAPEPDAETQAPDAQAPEPDAETQTPDAQAPEPGVENAPGFDVFAQTLLRHEIGLDLLALRRWADALEVYRTVVTPATHAGTSRSQAQTLVGLATALEHCGETTEARARYDEAHRLFTATGDTASAEETAAALTRLAGNPVEAAASGH